MKIEFRKLSDIRPYPGNPRLNDDAVQAVAASIREFGFRQPIVVDEEGVIIVGHTRFKAAQLLSLETVPVHVAKDLTPAQRRAYRIADNKTAELSAWDPELLLVELSELKDLDFDLSLLGFSDQEVGQLLSGGVTGGLTDPDDVPEPPEEAITQPGTSGFLAGIACCAATVLIQSTSIDCWGVNRFISQTLIRRTTFASSPGATTPSPPG
jgi:ParB-like chromosome segregation protein Spo0J